jgi:hypothetical protein
MPVAAAPVLRNHWRLLIPRRSVTAVGDEDWKVSITLARLRWENTNVHGLELHTNVLPSIETKTADSKRFGTRRLN